MKQLDESALAAAASQYIQPEQLMWIVIGDLETIADGVSELGFGEIVRMNSDGAVLD